MGVKNGLGVWTIHLTPTDAQRRALFEQIHTAAGSHGTLFTRFRDLVVSMADRLPTGTYADRFLDFAEAVEGLLGRRVDLVSEPAIRNPFFRREIEATRQLVYGRPLEEAAV